PTGPVKLPFKFLPGLNGHFFQFFRSINKFLYLPCVIIRCSVSGKCISIYAICCYRGYSSGSCCYWRSTISIRFAETRRSTICSGRKKENMRVVQYSQRFFFLLGNVFI